MSIFIGAMFIGASAMNVQTLSRGLDCARNPFIYIYETNAKEKNIRHKIQKWEV